MVLVATAVKDNLLNSGTLGLLVALEGANIRLDGGGGGQRATGDIVDQLHVNVAGGTMDGKTRNGSGAAEGLAETGMALGASLTTAGGHILAHRKTLLVCFLAHLLTRLSDLATNLLAGVVDALTLVRIILAQATDHSRDLSDLLLINTGDGELGLTIGGKRDSLRSLNEDGVGITEGELQVGALLQDTVANTGDFHVDGVAFGDTNDHVVDEGAGQAVESTVLALIVRPGDLDFALLKCDCDRRINVELEGALRPLDSDVLAVDSDVDAAGDDDRQLTYT